MSEGAYGFLRSAVCGRRTVPTAAAMSSAPGLEWKAFHLVQGERQPPATKDLLMVHTRALSVVPMNNRHSLSWPTSSTGEEVMYRCEATSVQGFVQQLAVSYLGNGYYFYVTGCIPEGKDARAVDEKLIRRYGVDVSKWSRARRKKAGQANIQYLRHGRFFVLLSTHGEHQFFREEETSIRDARKVPIKFGGYSISYRGGHPHVRIEKERYKELKAYAVDLAAHRSAEWVLGELEGVQFERYAPVRRQLFNVLREVNRVRNAAGFKRIPYAALRLRRRIVQPFVKAEDCT